MHFHGTALFKFNERLINTNFTFICNVLSKLEISNILFIMMPLAAIIARSFRKKNWKSYNKVLSHLEDFLHCLMKFLELTKLLKYISREDDEMKERAVAIDDMTNKEIKIGKIMIRATPIMEILLGFIIAAFIYLSGFLIANGEIGINNFFFFGCYDACLSTS